MSKKKGPKEDGISFDESESKPPQTKAEGPATPPPGGGGPGAGYYQSATTPTGQGGGGPGAGYYQSATTPTGQGGGAGGYYAEAGYGGQVSQSTHTQAEHKRPSGKISGKVSQSSQTMAEGMTQAEKQASIQALVGRTIDRYRIIKLLGEGGFGAVYKAEHTLMKREVAFKTLHKELGKDPAVLHRFKKEGQVASRFKHKHCIELYDFGQMDDGTYFMAMEFLPGKDLRDILKKRGALEIPETFDIMIMALGGLQAAHDGGVIHRDLKPDNIKLEELDGRADFVKILDFGIAKIRDAESKLDEQTGKISAQDAEGMLDEMGEISAEEVKSDYKTQVGAFFGTPEYGSPEQCAGEEIDARSDLYTMGVILYECLTGTLPFVSKTPQGYLAQHMVAPPRPISEVRPDLKIPVEVESVIMKALEKRREDRFQTATEFAQALIDVAHQIGIPITAEGGGTVVVKTPTWKLMTFVGLPVTIMAMGIAYLLAIQEDAAFSAMVKTHETRIAEAAYDQLEGYYKEKQGDREFMAKYKGDVEKRLAQVQQLIAGRNERFESFMKQLKADYDDKKIEDRTYDNVMERIEEFIKSEKSIAAANPLRRQLMERMSLIREERDRDAKVFWAQYEKKIDAAINEMQSADAIDLINNFPRKFERTPTWQTVQDKRTAVEEEKRSRHDDELPALAAIRLADQYAKESSQDFAGQVERYEKVAKDFEGTRSAGVARDSKIKAVKERWEAAAQAALAPMREKLAAARREGTAASSIAAMRLHETLPDNLKGAEQGFKDWEALRADIVSFTGKRFGEVDAEARWLRESFQPAAALAAVEPWTQIYFEPKVTGDAETFVASLRMILPLHRADGAVTDRAMVLCPAADVSIGEDRPTLSSGPVQRPRRVEGFYVDLTEVTNKMYHDFLVDPWREGVWPAERSVTLRTQLPEGWNKDGTVPPDLERHPVRGVSYDMALDFCRWAGKRLPEEIEWEYAARGPTPYVEDDRGVKKYMQFPWGPRPPDPTQWVSYCNYSLPEGDARREEVPTFPVRFFENGKSRPFGLYEMAGNVAEWTSSSYLRYEDNAGYDENYSNERKVVRGGSFLNEGRAIMAARCAFRDSRLPNERPKDVGFRCAKPETPPKRERK